MVEQKGFTMPEEKRISPIIDIDAHSFLNENFNTVNAGACEALAMVADIAKIPAVKEFQQPLTGIQYIVQAWGYYYRETIKSLKGIFSKGELSLIHGVLTDRKMAPVPKMPALIISEIEDAILLDGKDKAAGIDGKKLLKKLKALEEIQVTCLEIWCNASWKSENVAEYLSILSA